MKVAIGAPVAVLDGATTPVPVPGGELAAVPAELELMMLEGRGVARRISPRESVPVGFWMSGYVRRVVPSVWIVRARTEVAVAVTV